jgi:hypothetical protein
VVFGTGPLLVLAPLGLAVLVFGVAALLIGMATKGGEARRAPVMTLGVLWLVLGTVMLMDSPVHMSIDGARVTLVHEARTADSGSLPGCAGTSCR